MHSSRFFPAYRSSPSFPFPPFFLPFFNSYRPPCPSLIDRSVIGGRCCAWHAVSLLWLIWLGNLAFFVVVRRRSVEKEKKIRNPLGMYRRLIWFSWTLVHRQATALKSFFCLRDSINMKEVERERFQPTYGNRWKVSTWIRLLAPTSWSCWLKGRTSR